MAYQFPAYFQACPVNGSSPFAETRWKVYNRTGGNTVKNAVYMFDTSMSNAATTNMNWNDAASVWRNIVAQGTNATGTATATTPTTYTGYYCVATAVVAADAELEVVVVGVYDVLTVAALATQFLPKWSGVLAAASQTYGTIAAGNALTAKNIGRTLVAVDAGSASVAAARSCLFSGLAGFP